MFQSLMTKANFEVFRTFRQISDQKRSKDNFFFDSVYVVLKRKHATDYSWCLESDVEFYSLVVVTPNFMLKPQKRLLYCL